MIMHWLVFKWQFMPSLTQEYTIFDLMQDFLVYYHAEKTKNPNLIP